MAYRTPRARVSGLGAAGEGAHHWWQQRLSSIALVPLTVLFVIPFVRALGQPHPEVLAIYASPFNAVVAVLFLAVGFHHLAQGNQVVIEDYVHDRIWRPVLLIANVMFCAFFGLTGVFAVLKIAFTA